MSEKDSVKKKFLDEISEKVEDSTFESPFFNKEVNNSYGHFGSVIKEIEDGESGKSHLVKIRPPLFYLSGLLSNFSRLLSSTSSRKILDNDRWRKREKEYLQSLNPELDIQHTSHENAILMEKIDGRVAYDILQDLELDRKYKLDIIVKLAEALKDIHKRDIYHGEPNTQNCIVADSGDIYWIDFEIEYHEELSLIEKKANDLEQLIFSIMGAFESEEEEKKEVGLDDEELLELILDSYGDKEVVSQFLNNPNLPLIGPYRIFQLSFSSAYRFYETQLNLLKYINGWEIEL